MKACVLKSPAPVDSKPLQLQDVPVPEPRQGEVLVQVSACAVCRTDLHIVEGELPPRKSPVIPGHQIVGVVKKLGTGVSRFSEGQRVGLAWLHHVDHSCEYCTSGRENLCDQADFTGYTVDGGYAEYAIGAEDFTYPISGGFSDEQAAPLLCAGIIGFRCLRIAEIKSGQRIGIYGFGAAGHVAIQVAKHLGAQIYVATRDERHQKLAAELGAVWTGGTIAEPPKKLDSAIIFAPAGEIVPAALRSLKKGGVLVLGGIHMSRIPPLDYDWLYQERVIRSVANNTRADGDDLLRIAAEIPIRTQVEIFPLAEANAALVKLKSDAIRGAAVLQVKG